MEGYLKLYRKMLDWEWVTKPPVVSVFVFCLLSANFKEYCWQGQNLPPGSFVTSFESISKKTGLSIQQTRTAIRMLKSTNEITSEATNKYTIIYVENWAKYQSDETVANKQNSKLINKQLTNKQQTTNKQTTTDKELKELEEIKELKESIFTDTKESVFVNKNVFFKPTIEDIKSYCDERKNTVDPEAFWNFYESKGWKVGNQPMKKWQSAIITWEKKDKDVIKNGKKSNKPEVEIGWLNDYIEKQ